MAHLRKRYLQQEIETLLKFSPILGILGHRQAGKTTLLNQMIQSYVTLDLPESLKMAKNDPVALIDSFKKFPVGIDECQLAPEIFPVLKEKVRTHPKPGQFMLSGSVRFTSRKVIRESLTGRIVNLELLPMTVSELMEDQMNRTAHLLQENSFRSFKADPASILKARKKHGLDYLRLGGLPGLCFIRNSVLFNRKIETQFETILERDLQLLTKTRLRYAQLRSLLSEVARQQGSPIHYGQIAEAAETNIHTAKGILNALESLFMIRFIPAIGGTKAPIIYLEDVGESHYLHPIEADSLLATTLLAFSHVKAAFLYQHKHPARFFHFHTRGGVQVPFAVESNQKNIGFLPIQETTPSRVELAAAKSFLAAIPHSKIVFLNQSDHVECLSEKMIILPVWSLI